ncbi:hypothetical protein MHYP_G00051770 [Metynnis hypsauchen]
MAQNCSAKNTRTKFHPTQTLALHCQACHQHKQALDHMPVYRLQLWRILPSVQQTHYYERMTAKTHIEVLASLQIPYRQRRKPHSVMKLFYHNMQV